MKPMTRQDAFDRVWEAFVVRKAPPSFEVNGGELCCRYRGPNGEGCTFGILIPDDLAHLLWERRPAREQLAIPAIRELFAPEVDGTFVDDLQYTHDGTCEDLDSELTDDFHVLLQRRLREFATRYELRCPWDCQRKENSHA